MGLSLSRLPLQFFRMPFHQSLDFTDNLRCQVSRRRVVSTQRIAFPEKQMQLTSHLWAVRLKVISLCIARRLPQHNQFEDVCPFGRYVARDDRANVERRSAHLEATHIKRHDVDPVTVDGEAALLVLADKHRRLAIDGPRLVHRLEVLEGVVLWLSRF